MTATADTSTRRNRRTRPLTTEEVLALPVSVDLVTAGRAYGIGRTKSHELARAGEFPCRVIRVGNAYRVPKSALLESLGLATQP
jgi:hypothetical protein